MYLFECAEYPRLIRDHAETSKQTAPERALKKPATVVFSCLPIRFPKASETIPQSHIIPDALPESYFMVVAPRMQTP